MIPYLLVDYSDKAIETLLQNKIRTDEHFQLCKKVYLPCYIDNTGAPYYLQNTDTLAYCTGIDDLLTNRIKHIHAYGYADSIFHIEKFIIDEGYHKDTDDEYYIEIGRVSYGRDYEKICKYGSYVDKYGVYTGMTWYEYEEDNPNESREYDCEDQYWFYTFVVYKLDRKV